MKYPGKIFLSILVTVCLMHAGPSLPKNCQLIELSSVGFPASGRERAAVRINDLQVFNSKIYIGYGDAVINTGPTDVITFDPGDGTFNKEFTVHEEGIYTYRIIDNMLMIPGIDATDDWHFGNIYVLTDTTWTKHRSIPNGIHVNDLESYNGQLYASTGTFGNIGDAIEHYFGALFASADTGKTWDLAYATPSDDRSIFRITALLTYKDVLYAFPFAYTDMEKTAIPEQYHEGLTKEPYARNKYLIIMDNILGANDVITFDRERWQYTDILPVENLCYVSKPFVFADKLVMPALSGEYVDYLHEEKHLIPQTEQRLYAFDGSRTKEIKLDYDRILDVVVKTDYMFLLIQNNDLYYVVQTSDLKDWTYYVLPKIINDPRSLEYIDNTFFIGTESGNLFVSEAIKPVKDYDEAAHCVPDRVYAEAELPRDGHFYWVAITDWRSLTDIGRLYAEVKYGNIIKVSTENIARFSIFIPEYHIDPLHETTLIINDQVVYEGMTNGVSELVCTRAEHDTVVAWEIRNGDCHAAHYEYEKRMIGTTAILLRLDNALPPVCTWKSAALQETAETDGAIIPQTSIRQEIDHDTIFLEDIYDAHYRDRLCTFTATGQDIEDMIAFNLNQPLESRCSVSGFNITYMTRDNEAVITASSLERARTYTIVTTEFLAQRATNYLGTQVEYSMLDYDVYDALIQWFDRFHRIETVTPTIVEYSPTQKEE